MEYSQQPALFQHGEWLEYKPTVDQDEDQWLPNHAGHAAHGHSRGVRHVGGEEDRTPELPLRPQAERTHLDALQGHARPRLRRGQRDHPEGMARRQAQVCLHRRPMAEGQQALAPDRRTRRCGRGRHHLARAEGVQRGGRHLFARGRSARERSGARALPALGLRRIQRVDRRCHR